MRFYSLMSEHGSPEYASILLIIIVFNLNQIRIEEIPIVTERQQPKRNLIT